MGTGIPVTKGDKITPEKMNLKLETIAEGGYISLFPEQSALNTAYQNTSERPVLLILPIVLHVISINDYATAILCIGATSNTHTDTAHAGIFTAGEQIVLQATLIAMVPPGWYWQVKTTLGGSGSVALTPDWNKIEL